MSRRLLPWRGRLPLPIAHGHGHAVTLSQRRHLASSPGDPPHDIAVIGGGITGLTAAYYLTRELPGAAITLYEASDRLGGWISSHRVPVEDGTVLFEGGPRTLRPAGNGALSLELMRDLDLIQDAIFPLKTSAAARNRYFYCPDRLVQAPSPASGLLRLMQSLLAEPLYRGLLWDLLMEAFQRPRDPAVQDESVGDFFARRLSRSTVDGLVSAFVHGVYAGDVWQLSAKSLFPALWRMEGQAGSLLQGGINSQRQGTPVRQRDLDFRADLAKRQAHRRDASLDHIIQTAAMFTFKDGLGMLSDRLAQRLVQGTQVNVQTGTAVDSIDLSEDERSVTLTMANGQPSRSHSHVISALAPDHLSALTRNEKTRLIPPIPTVTVMTVNLYYHAPNLHPAGFGYLIPQATPFQNNPERALGVIFDTATSPALTTSPPSPHFCALHAKGHPIDLDGFAWHPSQPYPTYQDDVASRGSKLTVMLGGHWWADGGGVPRDAAHALCLARAVLRRHLAITAEPAAWRANLQRDCIPQYTVGHEARLRDAHARLARRFRGRLRVAGSWIDGVGVNDCVRSAWDMARGLARGTADATGLEHVGVDDWVVASAAGGQGGRP